MWVSVPGPQEPSELREYLTGPAMMVEVHDRDRGTEDVKLKASLFGDDLEDEKISNVGTVASEYSHGLLSLFSCKISVCYVSCFIKEKGT